MAPDRRLQPLYPWQVTFERKLARWRAAGEEERHSWLWADAGDPTAGVEDLGVSWPRLWDAERSLHTALRAGEPWAALVPETQDSRELFFLAAEGLTGARRRQLTDLARQHLDAIPHERWLAPSRGRGETPEFDQGLALTYEDHFDLWARLGPLHADLQSNVSLAVAVLARLDLQAYGALLSTLPPLLLHVACLRQDDPEVLLILAAAPGAVAASYGAWHYRNYLVALEGLGDGAVRGLSPFMSTQHEVARALTQRAELRRELAARALTLVDGLGGGTTRTLLLVQLARAAASRPGSWASHHLLSAATEAIAAALRSAPGEHVAVAGTLARSQQDGVLPAARLAALHAPPDAGWWRGWALTQLTHLLAPPQEGEEPWALGSFQAEEGRVEGAGIVLAGWLSECPEEALAWFEARFHELPVKASRWRPYGWPSHTRAAFLCSLAAETMARAGEPTARPLQGVLARELSARVPEWEWDSGLGKREVHEWLSGAVRGCAPWLTPHQRAAVADASRSLWSMVTLLDKAQLAAREEEFGARLEAGLLLAGSDLLSAVQGQLVRLHRWPALAACRHRLAVVRARGDARMVARLYEHALDELAALAGLEETSRIDALASRAEWARASPEHGAFETYALLVEVLSKVTGAPRWKHAAAEVEEWRSHVLEQR